MAKKNDHLHKYKRVNLSSDGEYLVYKCTKADCSHYIAEKLAFGMLCECNRCGGVMIMDKVAITLALPHCKNCTKSRKQDELEDISEFLKEKV